MYGLVPCLMINNDLLRRRFVLFPMLRVNNQEGFLAVHNRYNSNLFTYVLPILYISL